MFSLVLIFFSAGICFIEATDVFFIVKKYAKMFPKKTYILSIKATI